MQVLIYGGGAVGLGIASCILKSQNQVDVIARPDTCQVLKTQGLFRGGIFGDCFFPPSEFECYPGLKKLPSEKKYDYILVCVKCYDSFYSARDLSYHKRIFKENTKIILFQNGWGNAEIFLQFFLKSQVYNARVITGFIRPQKNKVVITVHADSIHLGSLFGEDCSLLKKLAEAITEGGIPCEVYPDIQKDLWAKMLYNCALNPLGALLNVPYGKLGEDEGTKAVMDNVVREIYQVMESKGYRTHWASPQQYLDIFYARLLPATAEHESSTLQDLRSGKRTEIDFLNGAVVKLAEECNLSVPYNFTLYVAVKFLEKQK
jgi:2-dehydropantoate 2-reductase